MTERRVLIDKLRLWALINEQVLSCCLTDLGPVLVFGRSTRLELTFRRCLP